MSTYTTGFRNGSQILQLMQKIASCIDSLLANNDSSLINRMKTSEIEDIGEHDTVDDTQVNKIKRKETD